MVGRSILADGHLERPVAGLGTVLGRLALAAVEVVSVATHAGGKLMDWLRLADRFTRSNRFDINPGLGTPTAVWFADIVRLAHR